MCDLHPNCATVSMLESANIAPSEPTTAPPAGFLTLTDEEYTSTIRQHGIECYYDVSETPLSEGQWASVYTCRLRSTGTQYAAKFCNKLRMGLYAHQEILHEVAALRQCRRCPRIVQLSEVFETELQYILVMEFGAGGDLQAILDDNQVPYEDDVVRFMRSLLEGLVFIHERNVAHLDIKPQNVVLTGDFPDCDVKLCDLEISRVISANAEVREMLGTPDYVAPEILRFDPVTLTADIWSMGVLAYVLLTGFTPFGGDTDTETFRNISKAELDFPDELFEDISELAKDFIRRCMVKDPKGRPSARQCLMHPWLQHQEPPAVPAPSVHGSSQSILSSGGGDVFGSTDSVRTLRRSVSKSREVLCEKVNHSHLKKNISKSRERLCDLKFGLSKSRDRIPPSYRSSGGGGCGVSRSSEVLSHKPPWRAAGVNCPLGKPLPPPMERMGSFKVRDQYQSQVVAGLGSTQSLSSVGSPFVRHCSLRGKRKQQQQASEQAIDFRSSLRRNKNNQNRSNSLQMDSGKPDDEKSKDSRRKSHSNRDESDNIVPRLDRRRDSRKELSLPPDNGKNMIIVEIISDGEEEDVFTRLYKDRLKDSELKWRKFRDSDFERDDDEKENKSFNKSELAISRWRSDRTRSQESVNSRASKSCSEETLTDRLNTLLSDSAGNLADSSNLRGSAVPSENGSCCSISNGQLKQPNAQPVHPPVISPIPKFEQLLSETEIIHSQAETLESEPEFLAGGSLIVPHNSRAHNNVAVQSVPRSLPAFCGNGSSSPTPASSSSTSSVAAAAAQTPPGLACTSRVTLEEPSPAAASWRRDASSPQRWRREASTSPEPAGAPALRRQPTGSASTAPDGAERGVSTDAVSARERRISTGAIRLAAIVDETALWERTQALSSEQAHEEYAAQETTSRLGIEAVPPPVVTSLRNAFECQLREQLSLPALVVARSRNEHPRQTSVPPTASEDAAAAAPLTKSSTDEDVRRRVRSAVAIEADIEKRSVAFADVACVPGGSRKNSPNSAAAYRRSSSLSSDLGSSEFSSDAGSELYCIVSWEEASLPVAAAAATTTDTTASDHVEAAEGRHRGDCATELKPVVSTRLVSRPRSQSTQVQPPDHQWRRSRSYSVMTEPFNPAQPWGPLCSGSVARAFQKFHSISDDSRQKRRQSSPNITALTPKVSDMGQV